jgi:hypothetical protein
MQDIKPMKTIAKIKIQKFPQYPALLILTEELFHFKNSTANTKRKTINSSFFQLSFFLTLHPEKRSRGQSLLSN